MSAYDDAVMDRSKSNHDIPLSDSEEHFKPVYLTQEQINTIVVFERIGASLSITGVVLVLIAFAAFKRLRTVPNTFIVFASFANLGASIACLIGYAGIEAGAGSALCQTQAFLFEMYVTGPHWRLPSMR